MDNMTGKVAELFKTRRQRETDLALLERNREITRVQQAEKLAVETANRDLLLAMEQAEILEHFAVLSRSVKTLQEEWANLGPANSLHGMMSGALTLLRHGREKWLRIDRQRTDVVVGNTMYLFLTRIMPALVDAVSAYAVSGDQSYGELPWRTVGQKRQQVQAAIAVFSEELERQARPGVEKTLPAITAGRDFPNLFDITPAVTERLATVRQRYLKIDAKACGVEDRFFLEQLVGAYLPDAWAMVDGVQAGSPEILGQVEAMLLTQLDLVNTRLQQIVDRSLANKLQALEAHTDFLTSALTPERALAIMPA